MAPKITYCATPGSITQAVSALSSQSVLLVDCEAQELGKPGGVLSIISLSGPSAKHVFLIDALAFPSSPSPTQARRRSSGAASATPNPHSALVPLLALFSSPRITKVFWDGRADALELLLTYGVQLVNVLDLQLVDVVARARNVPTGEPAPDLIKGYLKPLRVQIESDPAAYADIHALRGLAHVIGWFKLALPGGKGSKAQPALKDPAVVAMHEAGGSGLWLRRPLPAPLLTYAAHDLTLIALVLEHFTRRAWVGKRMGALRVQSAVYVGMLTTREENERLGALGFKRFMPLGIIDGKRDDDDGAPRYSCGCCEGNLTGDCFATRSYTVHVVASRRKGPGGTTETRRLQRLSLCRLCNAIALRNEQTGGKWVDC